MTEQQLYIDGTQMDLSNETDVVLDIKSNLFRDVTKMAANNTYTINLPKTAHNLSVLEHSDKPKASTRYPYSFHTARYFRNGLEVIPNGRLTVLSIADTIEVVIYWGIFPAFTALQEKDLKLKDLKTDVRLPFERKNTIDTYEDAVKRGYFYSAYNYKQLQYFENDWQGMDRTIGDNNSITYELNYGKVATGTEVGETIKGTVESDAGYKYAFVPFHVGSTARIANIIGVGAYRSYAVLDSDKNVLMLADDARDGGGDVEVPVPAGTASTDRIDYNVMWANDNADALTVRTIKVEVGTVVADTTIEYGVVKDMQSHTYEKWGDISVSAGTTGTVTADVGKEKKTGERLYLKTARGGVLLMKTVSGESCYEIFSLSYIRHQNKQIAYGFTYGNSGIQAENYTIVAPQKAAYIIINANQDYSIGTELVVTGNIDTTESGGWLTDPTEQPSVSVPFVLGLIKQQTGVGFAWPTESLERINTLAIPLISRNGDGKSIVGNLRADFIDTQKLGVMQFNVSSAISTIGQTAGNTYSSLTVEKECTLLFSVQAYWRWNAELQRPQGKRTWTTEDGTERTENFYQYPYNYIEIKVKSIDLNGEYKEENEQTYIVGTTKDETLSEFATSVESQKKDGSYFVHLLTGEGNLELKKKDIVTFELKNTKNSVLRGMLLYSGTIKATIGDASEVPYGGSYPIGINLPEIGVIDFVRFLSLLTGVFPKQVNSSKEIEFIRISEIWDNRERAIDWTRKLIPLEARNTPRKSEFSISDYRQHNLYLWKEDDTVVANYDADIRIVNETLDYSQEVWKMPFAPSDGNRVPIYGWKQNEVRNAAGDTVKVWSASDYKACKDRIMGLYGDENGKAALTFDIELQKAFDTKYSKLTKTLSRAHIITEWFRLSDLEILSFDETKPVYLAQYGAYFAVTELKTTSNGYTEATILQIEF